MPPFVTAPPWFARSGAEHRGCASAHLRALHIECADPGLEAGLLPETVSDITLAAVRHGLFGMLRDEGVSLGPQRGRQHPPCPVAGDLGQWIIHSFRLT